MKSILPILSHASFLNAPSDLPKTLIQHNVFQITTCLCVALVTKGVDGISLLTLLDSVFGFTIIDDQLPL